MIIRSGIDLVEIERVRNAVQRHGARFLHRIYTCRELADCGKNIASLAARFAAKEAVSKALGSGFGLVGWQDIEIRRGSTGEPLLNLSGAAEELARKINLQEWSISLTHTHTYAIAIVIATGSN